MAGGAGAVKPVDGITEPELTFLRLPAQPPAYHEMRSVFMCVSPRIYTVIHLLCITKTLRGGLKLA